jgi:ABC-2 type transport system permease protein
VNHLAAVLGMRLRRVRNSVFNVHRDSIAKSLVVTLGLVNVVALGLWVSHRSFRFIESFQGIGPNLNDRMLGLLFFALFILVVLSTVLISYTTLFLARETAFFFSFPMPPHAILFAKLAEAISFSSWASLFLCLPVLVAFGVLRQAEPLYYLEAPLVLVVFLLFAGLAGSALSLLLAPLVRCLTPRLLGLLGVLVLVLLGWAFWSSFDIQGPKTDNNLVVLDRFTAGLAALHSPYSPSLWASSAVLAASEGNHREMLLQGGTLLANTLIFLPLLGLYGRRFYGGSWLLRQSGHGAAIERPRRARRGTRTSALLGTGRTAALIVKDVLLFVRSPSQLSQSLLFVLLMVIYSLSLLQIPRNLLGHDQLRRFIHFANLAAVCMILSSFTSRFLFPLLSLDGRAFWILGLAPMPRSHLLRQKVLLGLGISLGLGLLMATVSNISLESPFPFFASALVTVVLAAVSLTALATGLGAAYPSFEEDNPARIAVGLGGTLNFFASAVAVAVLVGIEALPYLAAGTSEPPQAWLWGAHVLAHLFTAALCGVVLRLGGRALARSEF